MDAYQAGQQLGTLLFGSGGNARNPDGTPSLLGALAGQPRQGATYYRALQQGASAQNAMQEARANRAKALIQESMLASREKLPAAVSGVYTDPAQADLASAALGSNSTIDLRDLGTFQNPNARAALGQAATDMAAGNFPGYDQQTALAAGKPYNPVTISGTSMLPTGGSLGDVVATPVGQATINLRNAEVGAAHALENQRRAKAAGVGAGKPGKPATLSKSDLGLLGDIVTDAAADNEGQLSAKGQQDLAMLAANPTAAMKQYLFQRRPLGDVNNYLPPEVQANGWKPGDPVPLANYATLPGAPAAPEAGVSTPLGSAVVGAPAPGTAVRTDPADAAGAAAANALASADPSYFLPDDKKAKFSDDPRVVTLQKQATKAIVEGHADPARVAAKLQQEYSAIGYSTGAGSG